MTSITMKRAGAVALGLFVLAGTSSASALQVNVDGPNYAATPANGEFATACDRETDGNSIYNDYRRGGSGTVLRVYAYGGNGTCQDSDRNLGNPVSSIKACELRGAGRPDPCSSRVYR